MKTFFKAVMITTIFSVLTRALGFVFRIYFSRKLGAEGLGLFQMASSVLGIFMTLVSSGIPLSTAKLVSKYEVGGQLKKRNQLVGSALIVALVVAVLSSFLIVILRAFWGVVLTDNRAVEILIILVPSVVFSAIYAVFRGALWGQNDYFSCGLTELVEQIFRFVLTFVMLRNITDFFVSSKYAAIAFNLTCLISALLSVFIYFRRGKIGVAKSEFKSIIKSAAPITGVRLANSLVQPLTTFIIPTMLIVAGYTKSEAVASFGVIMGMTWPLLFVPMTIIGSISMVLIPSISAMATKNMGEQIADNVQKALEVSMFISMLFIPVYLAVGDLIGIVLYNNQLSGVLLQLAGVCVLPITLCNLTGSVLNALNLEVKSFVNYLLGSLVLFACLIVLTPIIGINSVIVSFFLSMTTITLLNLRKIKQKVPSLKFTVFANSFKYTLIVAPISLTCHFVANILRHVFNYFICASISGLLCVGLMILFVKIFNIYDLKNLFALLKRKKKVN